MWFCIPHQGSARHVRFLGSLVLLSLWFGFSPAFVPPVKAQAVERSSLPSLLDPRELEAFLNGVIPRQLAANHIPGATISIVKDGHLLLRACELLLSEPLWKQ